MTFKTISELFYQTVKSSPEKDIFFYKNNGEWIGISKSEVLDMVSNISFALKKNEIG